MSNRVHITGMGIISAIGNTVEESFLSLSECKTGIGKINHLKTIHTNEFVCGEVKLSNEALNALAGTTDYDRTTALGLIAAKEALNNAKISNIKEARTGFISSTTVAGMCHSELVYKYFFEKKNQ